MWPDHIIRQFQIVPPSPQEGDFHGPYNKLLHTLFPPDTDFAVVPQYLTTMVRGSAGFVFCFEIRHKNKPVFVVELEDPSAISYISTRGDADDQIRRRMGDLLEHCPLPTLHAVSAMGRKLCFYSVATAGPPEIIPLRIGRHPTRVNDYAPAHRWNHDLLEEAGEAKFRAVVEEILQGCANL